MRTNFAENETVIRTERGLSISGTRLTLYDVMDYVTAGWPAKLIRDRLNLSDQQIADVMSYIDTHRAEVEAEYEAVLKTAEENRRFWEARNRKRLEEIAALQSEPGHEALRAKLKASRAKVETTV